MTRENTTPNTSAVSSPRSPWFWLVAVLLIVGVFLVGAIYFPMAERPFPEQGPKPPAVVDNPRTINRLVDPEQEKTLRLKIDQHERRLKHLAMQKARLEKMIARLEQGEDDPPDDDVVFLRELERELDERFDALLVEKNNLRLQLLDVTKD